MAYIFIQGDRTVFPFDLARLKVEFPQVSFAQRVLDGDFPERLAEWGVFPVEAVDAPVPATGERVLEGDPELVGGAWRQAWAIEQRDDLEVAKAEKAELLKAKRDSVFLAGWTHDFGAAGTHRLDLRNADDKANWTLLLIKTSGMIDAGFGAAPVTIRTADNDSIEVTASEANAAMIAFLAWGEAVLARKWAGDEAITAAADFAGLAAIDIEADWP
jgi:hypothetical protein